MNTQIVIQPKIQGDKVVLEIPRKTLQGFLDLSLVRKKVDSDSRQYLEKYKGCLKNKILIDPLEYERKIRAEWDRDLEW